MYDKIKKSKFYFLNAFVIGLMFSCNQLEEMQTPVLEKEILEELIEESNSYNSFRLINSGDCQSDCIYAGTDQVFVKTGSVIEKVNKGAKEIGFTATQSNGLFRIVVNFSLINASNNGNSSLSININGNEISFGPLVSGESYSHEIPLSGNYLACEEILFSIKQNGFGKSVSIKEVYQLIPVCEPSVPFVGEEYQGGKVIYLFKEGDPGYVSGEIHGIILANTILQSSAWGCLGLSIATSDAIGSGPSNTKLIINSCPESGIAARLVDELVFNGFGDWYLPSRDEILLIPLEDFPIDEIVFGVENRFLTSSQNSSSFVYVWSTFDFGINLSFKTDVHPARVLRNF
jgi:hypothetical protein